jgi:DNA-binding protein Fis
MLAPEVLPDKIKNIEASSPESIDLDSIIKSHVLRLLGNASNNRSKAAKLLGIDRKRLGRLIKKFEIKL